MEEQEQRLQHGIRLFLSRNVCFENPELFASFLTQIVLRRFPSVRFLEAREFPNRDGHEILASGNREELEQLNQNWHLFIDEAKDLIRERQRRGNYIPFPHPVNLPPMQPAESYIFNEEAETKALEKLKTLITDEQYQNYIKSAKIKIIGKSGIKYTVIKGYNQMIEAEDKGLAGLPIFYKLCIDFEDKTLPPTDNVMAKILLIRNDEERLFATAYVHRIFSSRDYERREGAILGEPRTATEAQLREAQLQEVARQQEILTFEEIRRRVGALANEGIERG